MTRTPARSRCFPALASLALILGVLGSMSGVAAVNVSPGALGGFENDGNLAASSGSDWSNVTITPVTDDTLDTGFQGSSKDEEPTNWTCNAGGANPGKGNILRAYLNLKVTQSPPSAFLNLGFVRQDGNGDAHVNFEFNKNASTPPANPTSGACPINRAVGDFLVTYDFPGGSSPAEIRAWTWDGSHWIEKTLQSSDAAAATNSGSITDIVVGGSIVDRGFGELTLDLLANGLGDVIGCPPKAAVVNVRSRSSESITSALQDKLPETAFSLDTCGSVKVHKVDDHLPAQALAGATFGLYTSDDASGSPLKTCATDADGSCTFSGVAPADYTIKEISAPAGYSADGSVKHVTVGFAEKVDVSAPFVNPRDTGYLRIVKQLKDGPTVITPPDLHALDGTSFIVYRDVNHNNAYDFGEAAKVWPAETTDAACAITGGAGACSTGPLPTGTYRVHEVTTSLGTTAGPDVDATVTKGNVDHPTSITFTNFVKPINIALVKSGVDAAHVGDIVTYTFVASTGGERLHNLSLVDLVPTGCTSAISGPTGDDGDGFLEVGEAWTWTCTHLVVGGDIPQIVNTAKVSGTDDFGRSVDSTAVHTVAVLDPHISIVKSGPASAHEGDSITYSFLVTNTGTTLLHNTAVTDNVLGSIGTIGDLAVGASSTLTSQFTVPSGTSFDNTATACGADPLQKQVCDTDDHHLVIVHPGIIVVKAAVTSAHEGDVIFYTFTVTNNGDVPLHDVAVGDDILGAVGTIGELAAGASSTVTKDFTVPAGDAVDNTATACGNDPLELQVCDTDDHHLVVIHPSIQVVKSAPGSAAAGAVITYTFTVTNLGDTTLTNIAVTDDVLGDIGTIAELAPGATRALTQDTTVPSGVTAVDNIATACGQDPLATQVCDTDTHHLGIDTPRVLGEELPRTGTESGAPLAFAGALIFAVCMARSMRRRRRAW